MEFIARLKKFAHAEEGQDLLEYALLVALIALVAVAAITTAGSQREHDLHADCRQAGGAVVLNAGRGAGTGAEHRSAPPFVERQGS